MLVRYENVGIRSCLFMDLFYLFYYQNHSNRKVQIFRNIAQLVGRKYLIVGFHVQGIPRSVMTVSRRDSSFVWNLGSKNEK